MFWNFHPEHLGKWSNLTRTYFSDGLVVHHLLDSSIVVIMIPGPVSPRTIRSRDHQIFGSPPTFNPGIFNWKFLQSKIASCKSWYLGLPLFWHMKPRVILVKYFLQYYPGWNLQIHPKRKRRNLYELSILGFNMLIILEILSDVKKREARNHHGINKKPMLFVGSWLAFSARYFRANF